jgi:hypothetical protein
MGCDGEHRCRCAPDAAEENDAPEVARSLGRLAGRGEIYTEFNVDRGGDDDWYRIEVPAVTSGSGATVGARLDTIPADADYDLSIYYDCPGPAVVADTACVQGEPDASELDGGCLSRASGPSDENVAARAPCGTMGYTLYVAVLVKSGGACTPYRLLIGDSSLLVTM